MKKKNTDIVVSSSELYQNSVHRIGRIGLTIVVVYMMAMPIILGLVYHAMPSLKTLLISSVPILAMFIPSALSEIFSYTPILGSSSYLTFTTGNISNLKFPVAMNAMKLADVDQNTDEADAVSLYAVAVSSLLTMVIIALGVLLLTPLTPLLEKPAVATATNYMLPALFGTLIYNFLFTDTGKTTVKGKGLIPILPLVVITALILLKVIQPSYATLMVLIVLPLNIGLAKLLQKKNVLRVVPVNGETAVQPTEQETDTTEQ